MSEKKLTDTRPVDDRHQDKVTHLTVAATYKDTQTGALYVHQDLVRVQEPYAEEAHIAPMKDHSLFGDVDAFVCYVQRYGEPETTHLVWNASGLHAILDYVHAETRAPGRRQWLASFPFKKSAQWQEWMSLANGQAISQKAAVEQLEDLAEDITDPSPTDLMALLRSLRATVNAQADAELRPDGTSSIRFAKDAKVQTANQVELPPAFRIAIPVLRGHIDEEGRPVRYGLQVRIRVSVDDAARLALRFSVPNAERTLEDVYSERVAAAKELLGEEFTLLRAAD